ncbi:TPA: hypothetical protein QCX99_003606 [Bacillus thuringiensis]|nr:hypothetical protein [Bacillus thuringiensis]
MVRIAFLVEKMITLSGFFNHFYDELIITVIFLLLLNPFALHLIIEYFIMKLLSA